MTPAIEPPKPEPPKPDPPKPDPVKPIITDVVNAASGFAGPVAPGSLLLIRGDLFNEQSVVLMDNKPAEILQRSTTELLVETPLSLTTGKYVGVMIEQAGVYSGVWGIDVVPVAPAIARVLNSDDVRNSAEAPSVTGERLRLQVTGIRLATELRIKIHDRWIDAITRIEQDPPAPGLDTLSFVVPDDLPAMSTTVTVCGSDKKETAPLCAQSFEVFLRKP